MKTVRSVVGNIKLTGQGWEWKEKKTNKNRKESTRVNLMANTHNLAQLEGTPTTVGPQLDAGRNAEGPNPICKSVASLHAL